MRPDNQRHPDDEQVESYSMGAMAQDATARFEEHLLICDLCQDRLTESEAYISAMKEAGQNAPRWRSIRRPWEIRQLVPIFSAAAAVALVALLLVRSSYMAGPDSALAVMLAANRGAIQAHAPAGRSLVLALDLKGLPETKDPCKVEVVDRNGRLVWHGAISADRNGEVSVPGLRPGVYFVRISATSGELLREYGLEVSGT